MSKFTKDLAVMIATGHRFKGSKIEFPVYHLDVPIEDLALSMRAFNGLKRAGIMKADEILERDLNKVRNLGIKSVKEIRNAVLNYSYDHMTEKQRADFWNKVLD